MTKKIILINVINIGLSIIVLFVLFFLAIFWIGSKEQHEQILSNGLASFFLIKLFIDIIAVLVALAVLWLINIGLKYLFKMPDYNIKKIIMLEAIIYILSSIVFILIGVM